MASSTNSFISDLISLCKSFWNITDGWLLYYFDPVFLKAIFCIYICIYIGIGLYVNSHKREYMCYNQTGDISTLDGTPLKLVDKFTYLGSSVASTEKDIGTRLTKAWTAINRLSIIWKSDLTDKMKRSFFQAAVASILLYGCTTWILTKRLEKKLDGNYTRILRAILNKSWRQHPTRHQLYGHLPPITKTIQVKKTRHAGHCWRSRGELIRDVLLWTPHMAVQKQDDQHEHTFSNYVRIRDVVQKTCIYIYIYCHLWRDCFSVSQLFGVARNVGLLKLGSKPDQHYVRPSIILLSQQAYHISSGMKRD